MRRQLTINRNYNNDKYFTISSSWCKSQSWNKWCFSISFLSKRSVIINLWKRLFMFRGDNMQWIKNKKIWNKERHEKRQLYCLLGFHGERQNLSNLQIDSEITFTTSPRVDNILKGDCAHFDMFILDSKLIDLDLQDTFS